MLPYPATTNTSKLSTKTVKLTASTPDGTVTFTKIRNDTLRTLTSFFKKREGNAYPDGNSVYFGISNVNNWNDDATYGHIVCTKDLDIVWSKDGAQQTLAYGAAFPTTANDDTKFSSAIAKMYIQYVVSYVCKALSDLLVDNKNINDVQAELNTRFRDSQKAMIDVLKS